MGRSVLISLFFAAVLCPLVQADQVFLKNGDRLSGSIVSSDGKALTIKSEFAGTVNIVIAGIEQITSDQPLHLMLKDGQTVVGTVITKDDKYEVKTAETGTVSLARESVVAIRSKEVQIAYQKEIDRLKNPGLLDLWSGATDLGLSLSRGNAGTTSFNLAVNAARSTTRDKVSVYFTSLYARNTTTGTSQTTANAKRGGARYDLNLSTRAYGFGTGDLESDPFQKLDLRVVIGGGGGWHAHKTERATVDFFGGGALNKEYFSTGLDRSSGEALVGQEIAYKLSSHTSVKERATFFPNMSTTGQYRFNLDASATTAIKSWLGWQISVSDRYLSDPVIGTKSNDLLLSTGFRINFGK